MSLGGDLDHIRLAEQELADGRTLVGVVVNGDAAKERASEVPRRHGATSITHFDRGTIETIP